MRMRASQRTSMVMIVMTRFLQGFVGFPRASLRFLLTMPQGHGYMHSLFEQHNCRFIPI